MTQDPFHNPGFRRVPRRIKSSQREVLTLEFHNEPDVFYVNRPPMRGMWWLGNVTYSVSGPFPLDDHRFELVTPTSW